MPAKSLFKKYVRKGDAEAMPIDQDTLDLMSLNGEPKRTGTEDPVQIGDYLVKDAGKKLTIEKTEFEANFKPKFPGNKGAKGKPTSTVVEVPQAAGTVAG